MTTESIIADLCTNEEFISSYFDLVKNIQIVRPTFYPKYHVNFNQDGMDQLWYFLQTNIPLQNFHYKRHMKLILLIFKLKVEDYENVLISMLKAMVNSILQLPTDDDCCYEDRALERLFVLHASIFLHAIKVE